jgi:uncharacterized protein (TIGR03067 family)
VAGLAWSPAEQVAYRPPPPDDEPDKEVAMHGRSLLLFLVALLTVAAGAAAVAADARDPDPTKRVAAEEEARRLEGVWEVIHYEANGTTDPEKSGMKVVFERGEIRIDDGTEADYRVDPRTDPKRINARGIGSRVVSLNGNQPCRMFFCCDLRGIYYREGDRMVLCYGIPQPTAFRTAEDCPGTLMTLKRVQPKAK